MPQPPLEPHAVPLAIAAAVLVSWWKPLLIVAAFAPWAWVVSRIFDKDAARFYLPRETYNLLHLAIGTLALVLAVALPFPIFVTLPAMIAVLAIHIAVYVQLRNNDERVPKNMRWSMNPGAWLAASGSTKTRKSRMAKGITMSFKSSAGALPSPEPETPEYAARVTLEEIFKELIDRRGDKFEIVPVKDGSTYGVAVTTDGVPTAIRQLPKAEASAVMDTLKSAAGLDVNERRKKLRGELKFGVGDQATTDAWVVTSGSSQGMRLVLIVNPAKAVDRKIEDLGLQGQQAEHLKQIIDDAKGVVLLTSPKGHGRTTLLYAMIRAHDAYTQNIQLLELETPLPIEGVRHNIFEPTEQGAEFSTTARSILRRDPDVAGIAEMPDADTAQTVARADLQQTRVYLSLQQPEPIQAVQAYIKAVGDNAQAADSIHGVVGCRLFRRLCQNCRIPHKPTAEMLKKLGLPDNVQTLYRTEGKVMVKDQPQTCPVCTGTGYVGQIAAFAVHPVTDNERAFLREGDFQSARGAWRQAKQPSIQSSALQLVIRGETTIDRVMQAKPQSQQKSKTKEAEPA